MKKFKIALLSFLSVCAINASAYASDLSDWAVNEFIEANSTGLVSYGIASTNFKGNITREEFCELAINLYEKLTNEDLRVPDKSPFDDCSNVSVSQAYYNGIVKGVSDNSFEPNRAVTRQEMSQMLVNALNAAEVNAKLNVENVDESISKFKDKSSISDWAKPAMAIMANHGLMTGNEKNNIMPLSNTTREQALVCVNRCYKTFADINQDRYMLPIVTNLSSGTEADVVNASWTEVDDISGYCVIVKDDKGSTVYTNDLANDVTNRTIPADDIEKGKYSLIIGAKMNSGDIVFSVPYDFEVTATVVTPVNPVDPDAGKVVPIIDYSKEVMTDKATEILAEAEKYLGIMYRYGGTTPDGFDCSGFVKYVYHNCGIELTRVSRDQYAKNGTKVERDDLRPGDLLFFGTGGTVSHVGIYAGGGQMIHSPSTGKSICYTSINSNYYLSHYIGAKRVF